MAAQKEAIIKLNESLLDILVRRDQEAFEKLCDPEMTAFKPETLGHIIIGMPFHKFMSDNSKFYPIILKNCSNQFSFSGQTKGSSNNNDKSSSHADR